MTITDELRQTNGHTTGRARDTPRIPLSSGYSVTISRQPADVFVQVQSAARRELDKEKPTIPTQSLETEPGVWRDVPNDHHPDYLTALEAWKEKVGLLITEKLFTIMTELAITFEIDTEKLASLRAFYETIGVTLPDDDRQAWLSWVVAPTKDDQALLFMETYAKGLPTEQQVALQRAMFPSHLPENAA